MTQAGRKRPRRRVAAPYHPGPGDAVLLQCTVLETYPDDALVLVTMGDRRVTTKCWVPREHLRRTAP